MRILLMDQFGAYWGGQAVLLNLVEVFRRAGTEVVVMAPMGGELERRLRQRFDGAVELIHIPAPRSRARDKRWRDIATLAVAAVSSLRFLGVVRRCDAVHVNGPRLIPAALLLSLFARRRTRFFYHVHLDHTAAERRLIRATLRSRHTGAILAVSAFLYGRLVDGREERMGDARIRIAENALSPSESRLEYVQPATGALRVVVFGQLARAKGLSVVAAAAARLPSVPFHLHGDTAPGDSAFVDEIRRRGLPNLHFEGKVDSLDRALDAGNEMCVSLMPSEVEEGFGLVAIESMAHSCLAVVRRRGALPEIAERTGALVFDDVEDLVRALQRLASLGAAELDALMRAQHSRTLAHYGFSRFARDIAAAYADAGVSLPKAG